MMREDLKKQIRKLSLSEVKLIFTNVEKNIFQKIMDKKGEDIFVGNS